jgi:hypothetical protein
VPSGFRAAFWWLLGGCTAICVLGSVGPASAEGPAAPTTAHGERAQGDQAHPADPFYGSGGIIGFIGAPFGGNASNTAYGFSIAANIGWRNIPLTLGFDVMTAFYGSASSEMAIPAGNTYVTAIQTRSDSAYFLDLSLRLQPPIWVARPYLEGVVGTKLLKTEYSLSFPANNASTSTIADHDWAGSIGWGAGVDFGSPANGGVNLTLGLRRLTGANASFSRAIDPAGKVVMHYSTPTSTIFYMVGIIGTFGASR